MVHTKSHVALSSEGGAFVVEAKLEAFEGDVPLFSREWRSVVPKV
jgi:hypothetical protein